LTLSLDITDEAQVQAAVAAGLERFGQIDVLVNNAGFGILGGIEETSAEEVERVLSHECLRPVEYDPRGIAQHAPASLWTHH
jgi:NAD(P)-dependent dehydrogenase (short-subunit alcohol dehydrogenase family)